MSRSFGLVVRFTLRPGHEAEFDQLVSETLAGVRDHEPGTLIYTCHTVEGRPEQRVLYELYRDRAAFDAHEEQPHVRHFLAQREQHHVHGVEVDFLTLCDGKGVPTSG